MEESPRRWPLYAGAAVVVAVMAGTAAVALRPRVAAPPVTVPAADVTTEQVGALKEALVGNQVELARVDFENKDYKSAIGRAQRALALDATSTEARQVLEQAQRTSAELDAVAAEAKQAFDAGDTEHAARALARVLALDPRHPVAGQLSAALNQQFRKQAEDARRTADDARRGAEQVNGGETDSFGQATRTMREASALLEKGEFAVATQKFSEARDDYDRARRNAEAAKAAAAAAAAAAARPAPTLPPATMVARNPPTAVTLPPVTAPAATLPAPTLPAAPSSLSAGGAEPAIRKVIADYGRAIEGKDIGLFKAVKPNLTGDEEKRLQESFKQIKSQQVGITVDAVQVDGGTATVKVTRQDTINGRPVPVVRQVFRLAQAGGAWTIQAIGLQ